MPLSTPPDAKLAPANSESQLRHSIGSDSQVLERISPPFEAPSGLSGEASLPISLYGHYIRGFKGIYPQVRHSREVMGCYQKEKVRRHLGESAYSGLSSSMEPSGEMS